MKDFEKILDEALMERNEEVKEQEELAEEIIEEALKKFKYPDICEVYIRILKENFKSQIIVDPIHGIETKFSDLCYAQIVFDSIKRILYSLDDEQRKYLEDRLIINLFENESSIQIKIKKDA